MGGAQLYGTEAQLYGAEDGWCSVSEDGRGSGLWS